MLRLMATYCSVNVSFKSHTMIGRFLRSLYVGRSTEYLFFDDFEELVFFLAAMIADICMNERLVDHMTT